MINFKKIDDKDLVFISKPIDKKEENAFSDFLRNRKKRKVPIPVQKKDKVHSSKTHA